MIGSRRRAESMISEIDLFKGFLLQLHKSSTTKKQKHLNRSLKMFLADVAAPSPAEKTGQLEH